MAQDRKTNVTSKAPNGSSFVYGHALRQPAFLRTDSGRACQHAAGPHLVCCVATAVALTSLSCLRRYRTRSAMVMTLRPCCLAKASSSGVRAMLPSSFTISHSTPAGRQPARRHRSTDASVWPGRRSTPPCGMAGREGGSEGRAGVRRDLVWVVVEKPVAG